jgi:hypothetical protein
MTDSEIEDMQEVLGKFNEIAQTCYTAILDILECIANSEQCEYNETRCRLRKLSSYIRERNTEITCVLNTTQAIRDRIKKSE